MSKTATTVPFARTWQDINQSVNSRAMSKAGRQRRLLSTLKLIGVVSLLAAGAWGTVEVARIIADNPNKLIAVESGPPVKDVVLTTDGVLDHTWAERTLALPKKATLMALDLYALRARLLADGQVKAAVLTRTFPATLTINIEERSPVARVQVQVGDAPARALLVARDGAVYEGQNYPPALLDLLPWLDGVKLERAGNGFAPIDGMDAVADLLATAHNQAEHLYRTFVVVSLARLASDGELIVRSKDIAEITFSTRDDYVLDLARAQPDKPIESINLANGLQVPVAINANAPVQNVSAQNSTGEPSQISTTVPASNNGVFILPKLNQVTQRDF
jgi:hypothetical protein